MWSFLAKILEGDRTGFKQKPRVIHRWMEDVFSLKKRDDFQVNHLSFFFWGAMFLTSDLMKLDADSK